MSITQAETVPASIRAIPKFKFFRFVLVATAFGHLIVGLSFWFAPHLAVEEILAWGPASGWTTILG
ncbi:MAG: hypothetical protein QOK47_709, partial [Actinomycetota bacterium]|nr:hypothetical protein [Actinomycetota bacterium]